MLPETIEPFNLVRMLVGEQNPLFFLEIVVRTSIIYAYGLLLLRWLGSRTIGQLSTVEFLLVIALGSAVGDPMFQPEVPLLYGMVVMTVVVAANKGLDLLIARSARAERVLDGKPAQVVERGVLFEEVYSAGSMSRSELFQQLRHRGIRHLGQVRQAFVEPDGTLSVFPNAEDEVGPGLPIVPPWEVAPPVRWPFDKPVTAKLALSCLSCGTTAVVQGHVAPGLCPNCGHNLWTMAATEKGKSG